MSLNNALATAALQSLANNAPPAPGQINHNNNIPGFETLAAALGFQSNQPISPAPHVNPAHAFSSGAQSPNNSVHSSNNMYGFQPDNLVFGGGNNSNGNSWNQRVGANRQNSGKRNSDNRLKSNDNNFGRNNFGQVGQGLGNIGQQIPSMLFNSQQASKIPPPVNYNNRGGSTHSDATDHGRNNKAKLQPIGTQNQNAFDAATLLQKVIYRFTYFCCQSNFWSGLIFSQVFANLVYA